MADQHDLVPRALERSRDDLGVLCSSRFGIAYRKVDRDHGVAATTQL
jgi:hypothetical protein